MRLSNEFGASGEAPSEVSQETAAGSDVVESSAKVDSESDSSLGNDGYMAVEGQDDTWPYYFKSQPNPISMIDQYINGYFLWTGLAKSLEVEFAEDDLLEVHDLSVQLALAFGADNVKKEIGGEGTPDWPKDLAQPVDPKKPTKRVLTRRVTCQRLMAYSPTAYMVDFDVLERTLLLFPFLF